MPNGQTFLKLLRYAVITGSFLLNLPIGITMIYGNLATYTNSYFMLLLGPDSINMAPEWPIAICSITYVLGVLTVDLSNKILNIHVTCIIATLFFNLGIFLTYFTVQHSLGLLVLSLMVCCGYMGGLMRVLCFKYVHKAMPARVGLVSAVVASASGVGSVISNSIITSYINPDNVIPNVRQNNMAYFSQSFLLKRVPNVFLYVGIYSSACCLLGLLMAQLPLKFCFTNFVETSDKTGSGDQTNFNDQSVLTTPHSKHYRTHQALEGAIERNISSPLQNCDVARSENNSNDQGPEVPPLHVVRSRSFYLLCFFRTVLGQGQFVTLTYFKVYGQLWIKDDFFILSIISFASVGKTLYNIITGIMVDKTGIKNTLIIILSVCALSTNLWFFAPRLNKWLYFFTCQTLIGAQGAMSVIFPMASLKLYGSKHFATNYSLILMSNIVSNLISPPMFSSFLNAYGWFSILLFVSVEQTVAILSVVCLMTTDV